MPGSRPTSPSCSVRCELLEAERLRRVAEIDRRGLYAHDGHLSTASWLAATHRMTWGAARTCVRVARALEQMPRTRAALQDGEISLAAVRMLVEARAIHPESFAEAEPLLVEAARIHPVGELRRVVACWQDRVEAEQDQGVDPRSARRRLHASVTLGGMVRVDGDLDPLTGESLLTALGAVLDAEVRAPGAGEVPDERTPAQRRADALGEVCRGFLDRGDRPVVAGERPHLTVTVPVEVLAGAPAGRARTGARSRSGSWSRSGNRPLRDGRARPRRSGPAGAGPTARLRRLGDAGGAGCSLRAPGRGPANAGRAGRAAAGGDPQRPPLPVPGL